jgi:hypothetical protein
MNWHDMLSATQNKEQGKDLIYKAVETGNFKNEYAIARPSISS